MVVTELGCMGLKPDLNVMDESNSEGQILSKAWTVVTTQAGGPSQVSWGLEVDDPSKIWAFFDWGSVEEHQEFVKGHSDEIVNALSHVLTHKEFGKHITPTPSPTAALRAPATDLWLAYFPPDISTEKKDAVARELVGYADVGLIASYDHLSAGWGVENDFPVRGKKDQKATLFALFIGWSGDDTRLKCHETQAFKENMDLIKGMEKLIHFTTVRIDCQGKADKFKEV